MSSVPTDEMPVGAPGPAGRLIEALIVREPLRMAVSGPRLAATPRGDGRLTISIPGWRAPEQSLLPITGFLRQRGHDARTWGLGIIGNDVEAMRDRFVADLERRVERAGRPANLVGWSLGGVMAREAARERPELVHRVVTFGTPAIGGPTFTAGAGRMGDDECRRIATLQRELDERQPITTPITAIFSRRDGIVDWRACMDRFSTRIEHVEVGSSHVGLGIDPDVWEIAARALAS